MKRWKWLLFVSALISILILSACSTSNSANTGDDPTVVVYLSPTWGCCSGWVEHMEENGYVVEVISVDNLGPTKSEHQIPLQLQSCHTAIVDGYIIEGHVPADSIDRLLVERPDIYGLAVPGMPVGSPGMESSTGHVAPYDVYVFDSSGPLSVYASYGN